LIYYYISLDAQLPGLSIAARVTSETFTVFSQFLVCFFSFNRDE